MKSKLISPIELEVKLLHLEMKATKILTRLFRWRFLVTLSLCSLVFFFREFFFSPVGEYGGFQILRNSLFSILFLTIASSFITKFRSENISFFYTTVLCISNIIYWSHVFRMMEIQTYILLTVSFLLVIYVSWLYLNCKIPFVSNSIIFSFIFVSIGIFQTIIIFNFGIERDAKFIWGTGLFSSLLCILKLKSSQSSSKILLFNPANSLFFLNWPTDSRLLKKFDFNYQILWSQGAYNLLVGIIFACLRIKLEYVVKILEGHIPKELFLYISVVSVYFYSIFAVVSIFNIIVGVARVFGYKVKDATRFIFLARSPLEFWRRDNVYMYEFYLKYIYFYLVKIVRNRLITSIFTFTFFFFYKMGFYFFLALILNSFVLNVTLPYKQFYISLVVIYILLWFCIFTFCHFFWYKIFKPKSSAAVDWLSVASTHILLSNALYVTYILALKFNGISENAPNFFTE